MKSIRKSTILWLSVVAFWIIGDIATTYYGLSIGFREGNTDARQLMAYGIEAIIFGKVFSTVLGYTHYRYSKSNFDYFGFPYVMPVLLSGLGITATIHNTLVIF